VYTHYESALELPPTLVVTCRQSGARVPVNTLRAHATANNTRAVAVEPRRLIIAA
jgi:hypothetical protein